MHILTLLWRLIVLSVSLIVCTTVVSVAGLYAIINRILPLDGGAGAFGADPVIQSFDHLFAFVMTVLLAAAHVFAPWILAVAVTEIMRWRSLIVHLAAGAIVAVSATVISGAILFGPTFAGPGLAVVAALGLLGGFVHWVIAGRNAGRWSEGLLGADAAKPDEETRP